MTYRFSANIGFLWKALPFLERIAQAGRHGFDAVEFHDEAQRETVDDVRAALNAAGLPLLSLNTRMGDTAGRAGLPGREAEAREDIDAAIARAAALGGKAVHVMAGRVDADPGASREDVLAVYAEALSFAALAAAPHGLAILVEPLCPQAVPTYPIATIGEGAGLLARVGQPNVKLMFDCFHVQRNGGDIVQTFRDHADLIGHVQIAGGLTRAEPDRGEIAYGFVLPALRDAGYEGAFGCEYTAHGTVEDGLGWRDRFA